MSQLHILNSDLLDEGVRCRRRGTRGKVTAAVAKNLINSGHVRRSKKTKTTHTCGWRGEGGCFEGVDGHNKSLGKGDPVACHRVSRGVSALCQDCVRRLR